MNTKIRKKKLIKAYATLTYELRDNNHKDRAALVATIAVCSSSKSGIEALR